MNFNNPTQIQLGATGLFYGQKYRVVGRVLLGEKEEDMIYGWNEFNLVTDTGEAATLVFEQTQRGPEWRWFTMFEPEFELPAEDAATKRVGDVVNLDGVDVTVTLVQESRIYLIDGRAPEGQVVGSRANYFNAEAGSKMIVVSWTGKEMEYYKGMTISSGMVAAAFNLQTAQLLKFNMAGDGAFSGTGLAKAGVALVIGGGIFLWILANSVTGDAVPAVVRHPAPPPPLAVGSAGSLGGTHFQIVGHAQVEIAEVGDFVDRHEYYLRDDDTNAALLVCGTSRDAKEWILFTPLQPAAPLTPQQAGNVRLGQTVNVDGVIAPVGELFRSTIQQVEDPGQPGLKAGDVRYGFSGSAGSTTLLVRWNEQEIDFEKGKHVDPDAVTATFGPAVPKSSP
jgi:hypothetical protein